MEILYLTAVLAIIALCVALFSTARRILHSTPLTNGDLSLAQVDRLTHSWKPIAQRSYEKSSPREKYESEYAEDDSSENNLDMDEYLLPQVTPTTEVHFEKSIAEESLATAMQTPLTERTGEHSYTQVSEAPEIHIQPHTTHEDRMEVPLQAICEETIEVQSLALREDEMEIQPRTVGADWKKTSSRRPSHYALECLLIGLSVFLLLKTQRSTSRYCSDHSSHQVA